MSVGSRLPARLYAESPKKAAVIALLAELPHVAVTDPRDWLSVKGPERGRPRIRRKIPDQSVLNNLRQYSAFIHLYHEGRIDGFQTRGGAELALCRLLLSETKNVIQVMRLFKKSKLYRPKTDLFSKVHLASSACGRCGTCAVCLATIARFPQYTHASMSEGAAKCQPS